MSSRLEDAFFLVIGVAVVVNGFVGRYLYNDADMAMTKDELNELRPPAKMARLIYIIGGMIAVAYGFFGLLHGT